MDGQPLLLLFSVHVVYQFPPLAGAENRLLSPASPCGGFNSRAFYAELSGDMRISALKVRFLCSAPKARVYSGGVWVMPQARYVRPSAPLCEVSQDVKSEYLHPWLNGRAAAL